ncbi:MAG: YicC/YloC family endoribonuclease [Lachnospiraceae bacterium]|nr:YicC/YloC family endoribonuclease [Lachnospiraceae bacterium]
MIRSMTGYGKGENEAHDRRFTVEIKSVNHRYNDITIKSPRFMNYLEDKIRKTLTQRIFRGKTDVYINFETFSEDDVAIKMNEHLAKAYLEKLNYLELTYGIESNNKLDLVAKFPDVISVEKVEEDGDVIWETLEPALNSAIDNFIAMRETEGEALKEDIFKKGERIKDITDTIKERSPIVVEEYKEKLKNRLTELFDKSPVDEQRIAQEITIFADKACVDEELTRMYSHIEQLKQIFVSGDATIGRKLDFLIQEMNREANTTGSKSNDIKITQAAIELKTEIEKIREQIQNIE